MKNQSHILRKLSYSEVQNNFIFVDTESFIDKSIDKIETLTFRMACSIFWNRDIDTKIEKTYWNNQNFWIDVDNLFNDERRSYILFAHNSEFDMKMLNGFDNLFNLGWSLTRFYVRNNVYILCFRKGNYFLHIWDTMNYFLNSLKELGKSIDLEKLDVDFQDVNDKDLEIYCKRDTEIIYRVIKRLCEFLERHNLSKLRATKGALSMSIFKHKFYKPKKDKLYTQIAIHDIKDSIKLEKDSYRGGISDCYRIGKYENLYKMDINSMYPKEMRDERIPIRLEAYYSESNFKQKDLFLLYNKLKSTNGFIMDVLIDLTKENAYILNRFNDKCLFTYGKFRISLCTPELKFVEKYGKILHIYRMSVYRMANIFKKFITFFNDLKVKYGKENNQVFRNFCKFIMNSNYGKWSQRKINYIKVDHQTKEFFKYQDVILEMINDKADLIDKNMPIIYLGVLIDHFEAYIINKQFYLLKQSQDNDKESFVAISSFITSYSRMKLISFLKIAKRENSYYSDTDSIIVNRDGYNNLLKQKCIDDYELGKLKCEGFGNAEILKPKFYCFDNHWKCKGVRKDSIKLYENSLKVIYETLYWHKFKTDLKDGNSSKQIIKKGKKEVSKMYDKGKILSNNIVIPYSIQELERESV